MQLKRSLAKQLEGELKKSGRHLSETDIKRILKEREEAVMLLGDGANG